VPTGAIDLGVWDDRGMGDYFDGLGIGAVPDSGGRRLHGLMDEFYIFDRALSPAEIGALAMTASPGDFDGDQDVDGADFLVWQRGLGASHDATDLADWKANFGAGPAVGAVPEPSALLLSLGGMLAVARRRSR